ncbi:hypothetical protein [Halorussus salinisoli]|uniref:hypothetical protein n=1 Tax=Halorussus salinisoli TaxID=2558242 RepID=UPI0010C1A6A3|nr:hypothetical protein [Halorussus salinisoli]
MATGGSTCREFQTAPVFAERRRRLSHVLVRPTVRKMGVSTPARAGATSLFEVAPMRARDDRPSEASRESVGEGVVRGRGAGPCGSDTRYGVSDNEKHF